jgi:hypothetical protein
MPGPNPLSECHEGPEAAKRFDAEVNFVLSVPRLLIERRERRIARRSTPKRRIRPVY